MPFCVLTQLKKYLLLGCGPQLNLLALQLGTPASTVEAEPSSSVLLNSSQIATRYDNSYHRRIPQRIGKGNLINNLASLSGLSEDTVLYCVG